MAKSVLVGRVTAQGRRPGARHLSDARLRPIRSATSPTTSACTTCSSTSSRRGVEHAEAGRPVGTPTRPRVVVHAPLEVLIGCSAGDVAEIAGIRPVPLEVVRRLACDANVDLAVEDRGGSS